MKQRKKNDLNSMVTTTTSEDNGTPSKVAVMTNQTTTVAPNGSDCEAKSKTKVTGTSVATIKYKSQKKFETENM